jgi:hypothetical protein
VDAAAGERERDMNLLAKIVHGKYLPLSPGFQYGDLALGVRQVHLPP